MDERRVVVTAVAVVLALVASTLPLPGLPAPLLEHGGGLASLFPPHRLRILSLGIQPYLAASALWLLGSGLFDPLRRMRDGTIEERAAFDRAIVGLALILAFAQALAYGVYVRNVAVASGLGGSTPPAFLVAAIVTAGTAVLIGIAFFVTRAGVGNGVVWIVLATSYLAALPGSITRELTRAAGSEVGWFHVPLAVTALAGLVVLCGVYVRSARRVPLVPIEGRRTPAPRTVPPLPLRINLTGVVPAVVATSLLSLPSAVAGFFPNPPQWVLHPPATWHGAVLAVLIVVLTYVFTGIGFDTRRVGSMLARHGYRLAEAEGRPAEDYLDKLIEKRLLVSAGVLLAIVILPGPVLESATGISLSRAGLSGEVVLVACAIVLDVLHNKPRLRGARGQEGGGGAVGDVEAFDHDPGASAEEPAPESPAADSPAAWVVVFESDVEFETQLALATLEASGIRGMTRSNRVIPLTGTLALWEWTVPTYPSFVIHRRLGGGKAVVRVAVSDADRAREILAGTAET